MDYHNKYIKYKTKYLQLKYNNNQYGGGLVPCNKEYTNELGTCWAIGPQMFFSFGHLTSTPLYEKMETFKEGDASTTNIRANIEKFIQQQIAKISINPELINVFKPFNIFSESNIDLVKDILSTFIERYYNKIMGIPFYIKPELAKLHTRRNPGRCERRMAESFMKLFNTNYIARITSIGEGQQIYGIYLFCNLLSIFFLNYKVSFTNYYDNFNTIKFDDENDLGILVIRGDHTCCLYICDDTEKFYDDGDKTVVDCNWKQILQSSTATNNLYTKRNSGLIIIEDIRSYKGDRSIISKVLNLIVISKHNNYSDTTLDKDIKKALTFTELNTIKDRGLLQFIGKQLYKSNVIKPGTTETTANLNLGVEMIFLAKERGSRYAGELLQEVMEDYSKAPSIIEKLQANANAERQKDADIKYNSSINLLESGDESQYEKGIKMLEFAAANGDQRAYIKLGEIYEEGTLINKDLAKALEWYTKGERKFPGVPEFGRKKDQIKTMQLVKSAGENI